MEITADHITAFATVIGVALVLKQLSNDSKWKKTETAKSLIKEMMDDSRARNARRMIDWTYGRLFDINQNDNGKTEPFPISRQEIYEALDKLGVESSDPLDSKTIFVRDCFDRFFYFMGVFEHYIFRKLVDFEDVRYPMEYYVKYLKSSNPNQQDYDESHFKYFEKYITRYNYKYAQDFINRFE
ncbi:hypothetical protein MGMO_107c00050 [Methyloglobulus morosus KoM1]|uniref:Uncharacterized protein n=1 Tax=Methyloglobulus morosus KoM1 TaxID=1116472 RepID=V5BTY4_9GAMM|nr:hypothetical protein [Methyloglobulus morosus]ESS71329.1 hypothetical protein MGMO_107c00050 [Methyloglobulus morosus KoM1]